MGKGTFYGIIIGFGIVMILISYYINKRENISTIGGFAVANRRANPGVVMASFMVTWAWAGDLLGVPEEVQIIGLPAVWVYGIPIMIGAFTLIPVAKRLRKIFPEAMTYQEYFRERFDRKNHILFIFIGFFTMALTSVIHIRAAGDIIGAISGISPQVIGAVVVMFVIVYLMIGGIWSSLSTDWVQLIATVLLTVVFVPVIVYNAGGPTVIYNKIAENASEIGKLNLSKVSWENLYIFFVPMLLGWSMWGVASMAVWQRVFAVRKDKLSRTFAVGGIAWFSTIPVYAVIGIISVAYFPGMEVPADAGAKVYGEFLGGISAIVFAVIILGLVFSSLDSVIVALASSVSRDIYFRNINENASDEKQLKVARFSIIFIGILAYLLTLQLWTYDFLSLIFLAGIAATALFFPMIYSLFWKKTSANAVFITGVLILGLLCYLFFTGFEIATMFIIGHAIALVLTPTLSLMMPDNFNFETFSRDGKSPIDSKRLIERRAQI